MTIEIDTADCLAAIAGLQQRLEKSAEQFTRDGLRLLQVYARKNVPIGDPGNSSHHPGFLAASILIDGPRGSRGVYSGRVGPTVIYGRRRELGGHSRGAQVFRWGKYPRGYRGTLDQDAEGRVTVYHVWQHPHPYMKPAHREMRRPFHRAVVKRVAEAIAGS